MIPLIVIFLLIGVFFATMISSSLYFKHSNNQKVYKIYNISRQFLIYSLLMIIAILFCFPVVWMVANSFKTHAQINQTLGSLQTFLPYTLDVTKWFVSYGKLFTTFKEFGQSILNSVIYSFITIAGVLLINSFCGYALAKLKFPGSNFIINFIIIILIVPVETSIVPLYVILKQIGLLNENLRVVGYLLPGLVSPFYIFMFRSYFLGIPKELEEAAIIEGAGRLKVYFKIVVPLSLPVFATVGIFAFMGSWNEYIFAQLMFSKPIQQPLQVYLQLINNFNPKDMSLIMASLTFSTLPIAIVYIFAQKYIVDGVTFTGLK